ncbi:UNVERIFIED_CONTAM: hypothetical protein Scaly_2668400 [Sesamum calycinum]|uniref:Endonuclease/exonuclease/phosphatase domain-containing protein n=1 Tax=Sesamum calycinum TaxID=2727403 RepID=A0AAW2J840_9LAMI
MIKTATWNVRGLNKRDHQGAVTALIEEFKLEIIGLLETRVRDRNAFSIQNNIHRNWQWYSDYNGGPGNRIWVGWNNSKIDIDVLEAHNQIVHCKVTVKATSTRFFHSFVYASNDMVIRRELWNILTRLALTMEDENWIIVGDFNIVMDHSEIRDGSGDNLEAMEEFYDAINESQLFTLPMVGLQFSWHNRSTGTDVCRNA